MESADATRPAGVPGNIPAPSAVDRPGWGVSCGGCGGTAAVFLLSTDAAVPPPLPGLGTFAHGTPDGRIAATGMPFFNQPQNSRWALWMAVYRKKFL
jgi:hypothetical protein